MSVDIKAWMQPQMNDIHNHTNQHVVCFVKGSDNYCYMQYKHWNHNQWEPQVSPGIQLLQVNIDLVDKHVVGTCLSNTFSMI